MSVLDYPRIHFKGTCLINAATGNSNAVALNIDPSNVALAPELLRRGDQDGRAWMIETFRAKHPQNKQLHWYLNCGWNYFGDLSFKFQDVEVCAVTATDGSHPTDDPMIGQSVAIHGSPRDDGSYSRSSAVICDLDPVSSVLTQLFLGYFSAGTQRLGVEASCDLRAFGRWVVWRNAAVHEGEQNFPGAGATWQFAIPWDELDASNEDESPVLSALLEAAEKAKGIVVQFAVFQPLPEYRDEDLIARFRKGEQLENPVKTLLVGTIGVWNEQELQTAPAGRLLQPAVPTVIGPAMAQVQPDRDVVSLNLISTFPEADFFRPPAKYDFGPVRLGLIPAPGSPAIEISGPIPYDYATYESYGGIVDVPLKPNLVSRDQLDCGVLVLLVDVDLGGPVVPIVSETNSTVTVETDDRGVYLDDVGDVGSVSILVREKGGPPTRDVTIWLWEYQSVFVPAGPDTRASSVLTLVTATSGLTPRIKYPKWVIFRAGWSDPLSVSVEALNPGPVALAFTLDGQPLSGDYPWGTASYGGVRVLPADDFSSEPYHCRVSWDFIYGKVFKFYYVIFPAMDKHIELNNQADMEEHAEEILESTDPGNRARTWYMPISRDLSSGKRRLIEEWAAEVAGRNP
jgi:hypothetical protein